jgi:hypothetical protein
MAYPQGVNYPTKHNHTDIVQLSFVIRYYMLISLSAVVYIKRPDRSVFGRIINTLSTRNSRCNGVTQE